MLFSPNLVRADGGTPNWLGKVCLSPDKAVLLLPEFAIRNVRRSTCKYHFTYHTEMARGRILAVRKAEYDT